MKKVFVIALAFLAFAGSNPFFKSVSKIISDDEMIFEMFGGFDSKEIKMMEINYTR
ncbi:MAG: hypothetical protein ACUVT3_06095 [Ignavibacterium sp.]